MRDKRPRRGDTREIKVKTIVNSCFSARYINVYVICTEIYIKNVHIQILDICHVRVVESAFLNLLSEYREDRMSVKELDFGQMLTK